MLYEDFGLRLRLIRRYHNLTQEDLSKQLNISRQAYSNYEQGRCLPPPNTLAAICILLNTNLFSYFIQDILSKQLNVKSNVFHKIQDVQQRKRGTKMKNNNFATTLTEKRIAAGYTQAQAADLLYLARSTYNHYESGNRIPSAEILIQISLLYKVDPIDLLVPLIPSESMHSFPLYSKLFPNSKLTSKEKQILAYYRLLDTDEQKVMLNMARLLNRTHTDIQ